MFVLKPKTKRSALRPLSLPAPPLQAATRAHVV